MLWEHEPQASVSTAFSSFPKLSRVFLKLDRNNMENMFSISFRKHCNKVKENNLNVNFDYQNGNSLCLCHHYVNSVC